MRKEQSFDDSVFIMSASFVAGPGMKVSSQRQTEQRLTSENALKTEEGSVSTDVDMIIILAGTVNNNSNASCSSNLKAGLMWVVLRLIFYRVQRIPSGFYFFVLMPFWRSMSICSLRNFWDVKCRLV